MRLIHINRVVALSVWNRLGALRARVGALFVEREIYLRAEGRVRFVRITRALQLRVATSVGVGTCRLGGGDAGHARAAASEVEP